MEKLKEKNKHDHLFTKILKVSIFALVMLAPMFAVAAKCMYVALNKNAQESYTANTQTEMLPTYYESNEVNTVNDLIIGNIYYYTNNIEENFTYTQFRIYCDINLFKSQYNQYKDYNITDLFIYTSLSDNITKFYYRFEATINNVSNAYYLIINAQPSYFIITNIQNRNNIPDIFVSHCEETNFKWVKEYLPYTYTDTLDNVFYYSVEQIGNEQIFSWTKNTGIYGAINTMTTGLGIDPTNNILAVLLTYWSLITAVYIIIDIVIEMFVRLTHLLA